MGEIAAAARVGFGKGRPRDEDAMRDAIGRIGYVLKGRKRRFDLRCVTLAGRALGDLCGKDGVTSSGVVLGQPERRRRAVSQGPSLAVRGWVPELASGDKHLMPDETRIFAPAMTLGCEFGSGDFIGHGRSVERRFDSCREDVVEVEGLMSLPDVEGMSS